MLPVNTKSLFAHLCQQMDKLDRYEIDASTASAQASLVGQAVNILNYELKRSVIMSEKTYTENLRNVESKNFDSLPSTSYKLLSEKGEGDGK